jgi:dTDP-4-dehydrorhamnose 3,5-epimerase
MTFTETELPGVLIIEGDVFPDERGYFARTWLRDDFEARGLESAIVQCSVASNRRRGTIRGLHYQVAPVEEVKLIQAVQGAVFDVALDLRPDSPAFRRWVGIELTAGTHRMLYVPRGVAHGYQTLADQTTVAYSVSAPYSPAHQRGVRWNDPAFAIAWPLGPPVSISPRDASFSDFPG